MWREVGSNFARAETGSNKSGNHSDDFWDFVLVKRMCTTFTSDASAVAPAVRYNEYHSEKEGTSHAEAQNWKHRKAAQADVMASLAEIVALIVVTEIDKRYDETWKEQALLSNSKDVHND
ncbi:hypothetical protein DVH05_022479 [Phytophthora capsici]|nr:hypothetical protein DVH05_022479 [Phytophthora capsici]